MFTTSFSSYVCDGSTIECEVDGFIIHATICGDDNCDPPWERADGHGPVSEWTRRAKRPGERILNTDGRSFRYYDFAEAVKIARQDGWDEKPYQTGTKGEQAARAAEADFKFLKSWCDDKWCYVGVCVAVFRNGIPLTGEYDHALWGIEANIPDGDNDYLAEVANELLDEALDAAREKLATLCNCT